MEKPHDPLTAFGVANRKGFGLLLVVIGLLLGLAGGYAAQAGYGMTKKDEVKDKEKAPEQTIDASKKETKGNANEWMIGGAIGIAGALVAIAFGIRQLAAEPDSNHAALASDIRMTILFAGGAIGVLFMIFGVTLFLMRLDSLNEWLNLGKSKAMLPVVAALVVAIVGLLIAFLAIIPARAEERSNPIARRLVYGSNSVLAALILLGVLIGINAFVSIKLPVKLDTTASGFYTLDPKTIEYLNNLDQPITIYSTLGSDSSERFVGDIQRLLAACELANPARVMVKSLSPVSDKTEIATLAAKYQSYPIRDDVGVLIVKNNDEKRSAYISGDDFFNKPKNGEPLVFEGEGRLIRELLFLGDNKTKTVIYITQGSGELSISQEAKRSERTFTAVLGKLNSINCDVKPLVIDPKAPRVPEDAAMVIVADPLTSLPLPTITAISEYVMPSVDRKKTPGKFIFLMGANPDQDGKAIMATGLEPILKSMGILAGQQQIFSDPDNRRLTYLPTITSVEGSSLAVARDFAGQQARFFACRGIDTEPTANPELRVEPLLVTKAGVRTFLDEPDTRGTSFLTWQEMQRNPAIQQVKKYSSEPRTVSVSVSSGKSTQGIVIGCGTSFSDQLLAQFPSSAVAATIELFAGSVDTLRDRPAVASLATKQYGIHKPPPPENMNKAFWLPVLLTPLAIVTVGVGVWVVRRR